MFLAAPRRWGVEEPMYVEEMVGYYPGVYTPTEWLTIHAYKLTFSVYFIVVYLIIQSVR